MTSPIDEWLAAARLIQEPYPQADIDAAADRVATRVRTCSDPVVPVGGRATAEPTGILGEGEAAEDLRTLCETVVTHPRALADLPLFLSRSLPEPPGARVLGCILQLTAREDSARFWWQYAAGAGDPASTYCLYLHHLALGERGEAAWWHTQADITPATLDEEETVQEVATALRILSALKTTGAAPVPESVRNVLAYVPAAVGFVDDDLDLALPDPDFPDRIKAIAGSRTVPASGPRRCGPRAPLPARQPRRPVPAASLPGAPGRRTY